VRLKFAFAMPLLCASAILVSPASAASSPQGDAVARALADSSRPHASAVEQDEKRKPEETLRFAGVKPGQVVVDYLANAGYYTRLLSDIVGTRGHIYAVELEPAVKFDLVAPGYAALKEWAKGRSNVTIQLEPPATRLDFPRKIDVFWLTQNYHDLHDKWLGPYDVADFNKQVYDSLKPGGTYFVVDHVAAPGSSADVTETLHRIDPAVARGEIEAAGFCFVGESDVLRNPADPHTAGILDKSIRGNTDRFMFKFRKPVRAGACSTSSDAADWWNDIHQTS
jgi:predicted methyltransferase